MARRLVPITLKVNIVILVSLTVGVGGLAAWLGYTLTSTIDASTRRALEVESDIVYEAIEQLMIPGEAPLVVDYFQGVAAINPDFRIYLYRTDGVAAFSDNETIRDVNERIGGPFFDERDDQALDTMAPGVMDNLTLFSQAVELPARSVSFEQEQGDRVVFRFFKPLINLPKCTSCHGSDHTVRGVIDIHSDVTESVRAQEMAILSASGGFLLLVAAVGLVTSRYMRRQFIGPLKEIGATCEAVTTGDFDRRSSVETNDELGQLSSTVNSMVQGLYERFVLSRYVSGSTIQSLGRGEGARTEELTFLFSDIRGFTSFTESSDPEAVVATLNDMLNEQSVIIAEHGGDIDKYVGDEIVAVFGGSEARHHALGAALEVQSMVNRLTDERFQGLKVGIGINSGTVIVGEIGSRERADYTVIGDNVNVAARLCSAAGRGEILLSAAVRDALVVEGTENVIFDGPYQLRAKGKAVPLRVFKAVGKSVGESNDG